MPAINWGGGRLAGVFVSALLFGSAAASPLPNPSPVAESPNQLLTRILTARDSASTTIDPSKGVTDFNNVPNKFIFIIIGLIGAGFVITGIWFFFIAKNGGFYFHENDWDDYKTTVLRKKGPNGTTLSGASESTDLGGGSVVHGQSSRSRWGRSTGRGKNKKAKKGKSRGEGMERYKDVDIDDEESTVGTQSEVTGTYSEMSEVSGAPPQYSASQRDNNKRNKKSRLRGGDLGEIPESEAGYGDGVGDLEDLRAYRHEKPARVGGMNRESDSSAWGDSTMGSTVSDGLIDNQSPTASPVKEKKETKAEKKLRKEDIYKIRKVIGTVKNPLPPPSESSTGSFWGRKSEKKTQRERSAGPSGGGMGGEGDLTEDERIKSEARKLQDKGRAAQRRDFSFRVGDDSRAQRMATSGAGSGADSALITAAEAAEERERARREREEREERRKKREERRRERSRPADRETERLVPGSYADSSVGGSEVSGVTGSTGSEVTGDTGHKSYPCFIPGLSSAVGGGGGDNESEAAGTDYTDERRKKRNGGYRRG